MLCVYMYIMYSNVLCSGGYWMIWVYLKYLDICAWCYYSRRLHGPFLLSNHAVCIMLNLDDVVHFADME